MTALKVRLEELLGLTYALQHARYSDRDYSEVRKTLKTQFPDGSIPPSEAIVRHTREPRKAPIRIAFERFNLKRVPGFKLTQRDLSDFIGRECTITFYGPRNEPMYRKGLIIELYHHYVRLETHVSVRHYFIQYFRIIKITEYDGKRPIREIWYDKKPH
jgi:hypothetical protein